MERVTRSSKYVGSSLAADKGYDSRDFRKFAFYHGIKPNIPKRSNTKEENDRDPYSPHFYRYDEEIGVPAVLEQKTTICCKCLYLLASWKDSSDLGRAYETNCRGGEENPIYG
jgi:hypothetical protein